MFVIIWSSILVNMILLVMLMLMNFASKKLFLEKEKNSPFECGFDPKTHARIPFSMQFFLIAMIFLIFDVEITLIFPMIKILKLASMTNLILMSNMFMLILILGIFHEWNQGSLKWMS